MHRTFFTILTLALAFSLHAQPGVSLDVPSPDKSLPVLPHTPSPENHNTALLDKTNAADPIEPRIITPGTAGSPPSDAIILFDGQDLSKWKTQNGADASWTVTNGYFEVKPHTGNIFTKEEFGDIQLHLEWASPSPAKGEGQDRGNSGIYFEGRYEIQVLDSYQNKTYYNGQAAALYSISQPLVNACRPPGEWQTYDITFHPAKPLADGKTQPGSVTVMHNGVLVQDHVAVTGQTTPASVFKDAAPTGPLMLQDHNHPVRYRNIWVRKL